MRLGFFRDPADGVYRSTVLDGASSWLEYGFAGRKASDAGWPGDYARVRQIHSGIVLMASDCTGEIPEADAIVTSEPGQWVGIRTADCVPVLIADPVSKSVAAVHAGWKGTVAEIAIAAVRKMTHVCGAKPQDLLVAIGPAIGKCCFEVGPEVAQQFDRWFPEMAQATHLDLQEANRRQMEASGVRREAIDVASGFCTKCDAGEFHSWRRDRESSGRMVAAIRIKG